MIDRRPIRDYYNRIIGYIEHDTVTEDETGRDFYNRVVGYYSKELDVTRDFYNRIVARGNALSGLIIEAENKYHEVDVSKKKK